MKGSHRYLELFRAHIDLNSWFAICKFSHKHFLSTIHLFTHLYPLPLAPLKAASNHFDCQPSGHCTNRMRELTRSLREAMTKDCNHYSTGADGVSRVHIVRTGESGMLESAFPSC